MWFGGSPVLPGASDCGESAAPHGARRRCKRKTACENTYAGDISSAMPQWEDQPHNHVGGDPVRYTLEAVRVERGHRRLAAIYIAMTASISGMAVTGQLPPIRTNNMRERGVPYPWELRT